jgi:hypothetical protein
MYRVKTLIQDMRDEIVKPENTRMAEMTAVTLGEVFLVNTPETIPPMQKKHIVNVKFKASWEGVHPNSSVRGAFKIDQAYIIPAKSILTTPLNRYGHLTSLFFSCVFCIKNYPF